MRALYDTSRQGPYTLISGVSSNIALLSLPQTSPSSYLQIIASALARNPADSLPAGTDPAVVRGYAAQRLALLQQFARTDVGVGTLHWDTGSTALVYHLKPLSRGSVSIKSSNPLDGPVIDFGTGTDPADVAVYTALFRKNRQLFAAGPMQALGPVEQAPFGEGVQTDEEIYNVMKQLINPTNAHQCCTAAMMPKELGGVVNPELKVHGVKGLRVADASIWPFQIAGSPMATVYAVAEKLADAIKREYGMQ